VHAQHVGITATGRQLYRASDGSSRDVQVTTRWQSTRPACMSSNLCVLCHSSQAQSVRPAAPQQALVNSTLVLALRFGAEQRQPFSDRVEMLLAPLTLTLMCIHLTMSCRAPSNRAAQIDPESSGAGEYDR
jgi:hypothetical protein